MAQCRAKARRYESTPIQNFHTGSSAPPLQNLLDYTSAPFVHREEFQEIPGHEWMGYAQFLYDAASDTFKPYGSDSSFEKKICYQCHTRVKAQDFIFTSYARR
jgi:hypothetical protein